MSDAEIWVTFAALLVAALSLAVALRADRRADRVDRRSRSASLRIAQVGGEIEVGDSYEPVRQRLDYRIVNHGLATARGVRLWLRDPDGRPASTIAGGPGRTLTPEARTVESVWLPPDYYAAEPEVWIAYHDSRPAPSAANQRTLRKPRGHL